MTAFLVGVVGMQQSGSTLLFNLVRFICDEMKISCYSSWLGNKFDKKKLEMYRVVVVKTHESNKWLNDNANLLLLPIRDLRDASISYSTRVKKSWKVENHIKNMITNIRFFQMWSESPISRVFVYEKYMKNRKEWILKLSKWLGMPRLLNDIQITNIIHKSDLLLNNPKKGTLMTRAHNTSGGKSQKYLSHFSEKDRQKILENAKVRNFLIKHGYHHCELTEIVSKNSKKEQQVAVAKKEEPAAAKKEEPSVQSPMSKKTARQLALKKAREMALLKSQQIAQRRAQQKKIRNRV